MAFKNLRVAPGLQMRKEEADSTATKRGNLLRICPRAHGPSELPQENSTWLTCIWQKNPAPGQTPVCDLLGLTMGNYNDFSRRSHGANAV